jgi:hypothetical protein
LTSFLERLDRLEVRHASLRQAQPSWFKQRFGMFTIVHPQTQVADQGDK